MRLRSPRSRLIAAAALIAVGTLTSAATLATGIETREPIAIPDSAFQPVSFPPTSIAPVLDTLSDVATPTAPPVRAQPSMPAPRPIVVAVAPKTTHAISGPASWYCRAGWSPCTAGYPDDGGVDAYAAAGPRLRAAIGDWRGKIVWVDGLRVRLIDWCQCYEGQSNEKLLDLYHDVYARVGGRVTIRW